MRVFQMFAAGFCLALLLGCPLEDDDVAADDDDATADDDGGDDDSDPSDLCDDFPGEVICDGQTEVTCDAAGDIAGTEDCDTQTDFYCHWGLGCVICYPGVRWCEGQDAVERYSEELRVMSVLLRDSATAGRPSLPG